MTKIFTNPFVYLILFMILVHTARLITKTPFHGQKTYVPSTDKMFITLYILSNNNHTNQSNIVNR